MTFGIAIAVGWCLLLVPEITQSLCVICDYVASHRIASIIQNMHIIYTKKSNNLVKTYLLMTSANMYVLRYHADFHENLLNENVNTNICSAYEFRGETNCCGKSMWHKGYGEF